jgi:hypothetical protein
LINMTFEDLLKYIAAIICVVALVFWVIPGIFWAATGVIWNLVMIAIYGVAGFILVKIIIECFKKKK